MFCAAFVGNIEGRNVNFIMTEHLIEFPKVKPKGGQITTKKAAFSENECFHEGYEVTNLCYLSPEETRPITPTQYSTRSVAFTTTSGEIKYIPLFLCPGYPLRTRHTVQSGSTTTVTEYHGSCNGNTGRYYGNTVYTEPRRKKVVQTTVDVVVTYQPLTRKFISSGEGCLRVFIGGILVNENVYPILVTNTPSYFGEISDLVDPMPRLMPYIHSLQKSVLHSGEIAKVRNFATRELLSSATTASLKNMSSLMNMNTANYLYELKEVLGIVNDLAKVVANPTSPASWANFYLSAKWGTPQTLRETEELMRKLVKRYTASKRFAYKVSRGKVTHTYSTPFGPVDVTCTCKLRAENTPGWAQGLVRKGVELGLWPTFKGVYDFIPFSFVCDWFSNLGEVLEAIDLSLYSEYHTVHQALYSIKETITIPFSAVALDESFSPMSVRLVRYRRMAFSNAIRPAVPKLDLDNPTATNILDGGALIIQRL